MSCPYETSVWNDLWRFITGVARRTLRPGVTFWSWLWSDLFSRSNKFRDGIDPFDIVVYCRANWNPGLGIWRNFCVLLPARPTPRLQSIFVLASILLRAGFSIHPSTRLNSKRQTTIIASIHTPKYLASRLHSTTSTPLFGWRLDRTSSTANAISPDPFLPNPRHNPTLLVHPSIPPSQWLRKV